MVYYVDNTTDLVQPNYSHLQQGKLITHLYFSSYSSLHRSSALLSDNSHPSSPSPSATAATTAARVPESDVWRSRAIRSRNGNAKPFVEFAGDPCLWASECSCLVNEWSSALHFLSFRFDSQYEWTDSSSSPIDWPSAFLARERRRWDVRPRFRGTLLWSIGRTSVCQLWNNIVDRGVALRWHWSLAVQQLLCIPKDERSESIIPTIYLAHGECKNPLSSRHSWTFLLLHAGWRRTCFCYGDSLVANLVFSLCVATELENTILIGTGHWRSSLCADKEHRIGKPLSQWTWMWDRLFRRYFSTRRPVRTATNR